MAGPYSAAKSGAQFHVVRCASDDDAEQGAEGSTTPFHCIAVHNVTCRRLFDRRCRIAVTALQGTGEPIS
jgi:hypothetical protein